MTLLHDVFCEASRKHGHRVAFDSLDHQITFSEFYERAEFLAGALEGLGVKKGDRVAILSHNCPDYIIYHCATAMIGAILLVLNIRHTEGELLWAMEDAGASMLIIDENFSSLLPALTGKCAAINTTISIGNFKGVNHSTDDLVNKGLLVKGRKSILPTDPILLIYTSGTTGRPKGALQTHQSSTMADALTVDSMGITEKDVYLAFLPFFHQAGLIRCRATLSRGGTSIVPGKMDAEKTISIMSEKKVSITFLPEPLDTQIEELADRNKLTFPSLRFIIGAGGKGNDHAKKLENFCRKFKSSYLGVYGQTETTGTIVTVMGEDYFKNPYTCGKAMKGVDLEIWDDNKSPVPPGTVGEIMVRSKMCIPGYWNNEQATRELYSGEWLHTGDLAWLDEEAFLHFVDRKKELIKTGGENVYPREVMDILENHPSIDDLAIIGLKDPKWGESVTAVVVLEPGKDLTLEEIREYCRGKISGYKIPKILKLVDEIPRNHTGKILKTVLIERFKTDS
jgi:fatty-acyl-CoA synthase